MLEQYLGLAGMLAIGILIVLVLYRLATRLQRKLGLESTADTPRTDAGGSGPGEPSARSTSRYFFIAIVGLTLHAGSIYFYLWGATVREAGLTGMVVMLGFGMCLIVGVFYSWARGAVTHAIESEAETRAD
jgi:NADH:ubiquinone oxidoreductase subunit 3 (subunit A)